MYAVKNWNEEVIKWLAVGIVLVMVSTTLYSPYEIVRYLAGKKETILTKEDIKEYLTLALSSIILIVIASSEAKY